MLYIRAMAYLRRPLLDDDFPETDYQEQVRLLADVCDTLVPATARSARRGLEWTYRTRASQRQWMIKTLAEWEIDLLALIAVNPEQMNGP